MSVLLRWRVPIVVLLAPAAIALAVWGTRAGPWATETLALTFRPHPARLDDAASLLAMNLKVVAILLLAALAVSALRDGTRRPARLAADLLVTVVLVVNVLPLGLALGGYGPARLLPWIPHWPLEAAALAVALDNYLRARTGPVQARVVLRAGGVALVLLMAGAVVETFATPHA